MLDFERSNLVYVSVTAQDGGEQSRSAQTNVTVLVQDVQDEVPYFPQTEYRVLVPENRADHEVVRVTALDRDTLAVITYRIMEGDVTKFTVSPETGEVRTLQGLDYERAREHTLVIGTEQAMVQAEGDRSNTVTKVVVTVTDENDLPPRFTSLPPGNTFQVKLYSLKYIAMRNAKVRNDAPPGQVLARLGAEDDDSQGSLTFSLVPGESSERAAEYFSVTSQGEIVLQVTQRMINMNYMSICYQGDLTNELYEEYELSLLASDSGEPSLSSQTSVRVRVLQVVTLPPNTGVGFEDGSHVIQVMENTPQEAVLRVLRLGNKPQRNIRIQCEVESVEDSRGMRSDELFRAELSPSKDCELILARSRLDHEVMTSYTVTMRINTLTAFVNKDKQTSVVEVQVQDKNDNSPEWLHSGDYRDLVPDKFLFTLSPGMGEGEVAGVLAARDRDSGALGRVRYEMSPDTEPRVRSVFRVSPDTGELSLRRPVEEVEAPWRLVISARDNPDNPGDSNVVKTEVVVNLVTEDNLVVLTVKNSGPEEVSAKAKELEALMRDQTGLVVEVSRVVGSLVEAENGTCCVESDIGSDVWFYAIDPNTQEILSVNSSTVQNSIVSKAAQTSIRYTITGLGVFYDES